MIKGKTIIELTDVKTGKIERREDDNMVTNALQHIFEPLGHYKTAPRLLTSSDMIPFYQNLLGGLLLFDGEIPENAEQLFPPVDVNMTGCGVYGRQNDTVCVKRGDYNMTESEVNLSEKYVKFVYDFTTSQGNGNIACVALTSKHAGYCGYGASDATMIGTTMAFYPTDNAINFMGQSNCAKKGGSVSLGVTQFLFAVDAENDILWYLRVNSAKSLSIVKRKGYFKTVGVFDTPSSSGRLIETIDLPDMSTGLLNTSNLYYNYVESEKCVYIYSSANYYLDAGGVFSVIKINIQNNAVTEYSMTNQTNTRLSLGSQRTCVYGGFIYVTSYNSTYKMYKIGVGNSADVREITIPSVLQATSMDPIFMANGRIFYDAYSHSYMSNTERAFVLNTESEEILPLETRYICGGSYSTLVDAVPVIGHQECMCFYGQIFYPAMYLATINNLGEPVTKTADKTMKVTYIIREHEE